MSEDAWNWSIIEEFRANEGEIRTRWFGRSLVLLHTVGARSGKWRISPVMALHDPPDVWLIAAAAGGGRSHPGWFFNLCNHPDARIETPSGIEEVCAEVLRGAERADAWQRFISISPGYAHYGERASRTIPVLALRRHKND